jgi:O-antigen ligase
MTGFFGPALLVFTAAAFVLPGEASYGLVFYIVMLPLVAWHCRHRKLPGRALGLAFLLIAWSGLTLLWTEDPGHRRAGFAFATLCTAAFVTALDATFADPAWRRRWAGLLVWAGAGNAAWSLLHGLPSLHAGERILGWGVTRQPILGGAVMSLAYLTAASRAGTSGCSPRSRILYLAAATAMAAFVLAMQSRGALLAAAGGTILLLAAGPWRLRAAMAFAAAFAAWFIVIPESWHRHLSQLLLERGTSHRFEIWSVTWRLIRQKPILGHGLAANVPPSPTGFPHSLILSLLFYSGSIGLLLFLALAGLAAIRLAKTPKTPDRVWVAAICLSGLLAGLTDLGQITKGPGPIWLIIWAPLFLALTSPAAAAAPRAPATPPPPLDAATAVPPAPRNPVHDRDGADAPPRAPPRNPAPGPAPSAAASRTSAPPAANSFPSVRAYPAPAPGQATSLPLPPFLAPR